jgi:hypothetical protein
MRIGSGFVGAALLLGLAGSPALAAPSEDRTAPYDASIACHRPLPASVGCQADELGRRTGTLRAALVHSEPMACVPFVWCQYVTAMPLTGRHRHDVAVTTIAASDGTFIAEATIAAASASPIGSGSSVPRICVTIGSGATQHRSCEDLRNGDVVASGQVLAGASVQVSVSLEISSPGRAEATVDAIRTRID